MQNGERRNPAREPAKRLIFDSAPTMSLRGPVLTFTARREAPSLMGRVDGDQKCPLNFFELCGYLELVYIYLYTK